MTKVFDEATRRELRLALRKTGVSVKDAPIIVDLACHVAEKTVADLFSTCRTAPTTDMAWTAIQIALQLTTARLQSISRKADFLNTIVGGTINSVEVGVRL